MVQLMNLLNETSVKEKEDIEFLFNFIGDLPIGIARNDINENSPNHFNRFFIDMFGWQEEEISSMEKWFSCAYPDENYRSKTVERWINLIEETNKAGRCSSDPIDVKVACKDGSFKWCEVRYYHKSHYVYGIFYDISERKLLENRLQNLSLFDPLTGLPNRLLLEDRLNYAIRHIERSGAMFAVCMIDLDGFKEVNDCYGHESGDAVLIEASRRMQNTVRSEDTVARIGGDEFVILLNDLENNDTTALAIYRILNALSTPYQIKNNWITSVSASIGVTIFPDDNVDPSVLIAHADKAMYISKEDGKNRFTFFDSSSDRKIKANVKTIKKIHTALQNKEFFLYFQPKVSMPVQTVNEVEVLVRWHHPLLGTLLPDQFLPLIENEGDLNDLFDQWMIIETLQQLRHWHQNGMMIKASVNISSRQFKKRMFFSWLIERLQENAIDTAILSWVVFEVDETVVMENLHLSKAIIEECRAYGICFVLNHFGTGCSSLPHLKELHIDTIKIDRTFVAGMLEDPSNMTIVKATAALSRIFDIQWSAQGAETMDIVHELLNMGCASVQGHALAYPMNADEVELFIRKTNNEI